MFAKLQQRLEHQPALLRSDVLSVRLLQAISFQTITHSFAQRPAAIPFSFNHFRTLFVLTEGAPSLHSNFAQFLCNLSPFRINTYRPPRKCCKQKTYRMTKSFRCNTYKKPGVHPSSQLSSSALVLPYHLASYWKPARFIPFCAAGSFMNVFHTNCVRWFSAIKAEIPRSIPITSLSYQPVKGLKAST